GWMKQVFGAAGSFILLTLAALVTLLLIVDHDIQVTLDRAGEFVASLRGRTGEKWAAVKASHEERVEARATILAERRAEREARQKEKIKQRKEREKEARSRRAE